MSSTRRSTPPPAGFRAIQALAAGADELAVARELGLDERELLEIVYRTLAALDVDDVGTAAAILANGHGGGPR